MIEILRNRFQHNMTHHPDLTWECVEARLRENDGSLDILRRTEETGGEPDAIGFDEDTGKLIFCDCAAETPAGRRSLFYDDEALRKRTRNPPVGSAVHQAQEMGAQHSPSITARIRIAPSVDGGVISSCESRFGKKAGTTSRQGQDRIA